MQFSFFSLAADAATNTYHYRAQKPLEEVLDANGTSLSTKPLTNCNYLTFQNIPPLSGQAQTLEFICEQTPNAKGVSHLPAIWFQKGYTKYHYTYERNDRLGIVYRFLTLVSSEFPNETLQLQINSDFSGPCFVYLYNSRTNHVYSLYINAPEGAQLFKMVARLIRNLNIPKALNNTLNIDIN